ncbi:alkaline phosphatase [Amycolatopsis australiensis]|uniref:Alkaline phosphatase n=1 Tax=Amycolatopsis australiensis TaxID=546364 RepID=A0A1K1RZP8_9PSEU|nr:alkaline phosphatase [Amycolatopsis australiensis]SFW77284.1 alkaline phosphatase [Amycolatopsis australiensis]
MASLFAGRRRWLVAGALGAALVAAAPVALATNGSGNADARSAGTGDRTADVRAVIQGGHARNVILFIGDGMGQSEITAARNYERGAAGRLAMDELPLTGDYTTYAVEQNNPAKPDYVTDSAASGTGWATGTKTYNGAISVDAYGNPVPTILELAKRNGLRTGDVTTAEVQDATPAVLGAHVVNRDCKGPDETTAKCAKNAKENGGAGSIAEQLVQTRPDVLLGGGAKYFNQKVKAGKFAGQTVLDQAKAAGYAVVGSAADLAAAKRGKPVLGLFADGNMPVNWTGPAAVHGGTAPARCAPNPKVPATQPKLADQTRKALELLDDRHSDKGFFLQVEGASIDKQDHAADPCGQIGETVDFDAAIAAGEAFARSHPDTLVLVTADHGHSSQIVEPTATPGLTATLITNEGANMTLAYGTAEPGGSQSHTGTQVRIAGMGPQAANVVGLTNQTDLFGTLKRALKLR